MARLVPAVLLVVTAILACPAPAAAAEPAPAPRALYPKFDLTYMPQMGGQGVIGLRPSEIARYASGKDVKRASQMMVGLISKFLGDGELEVDTWPTFDEVEECVFCLNISLTAPTDDERGTFLLGGSTPGVIRTVRPFNWDGTLAKSFPAAKTVRRAGRSYLGIPLPRVFGDRVPKDAEGLGAYVADDRTLVIGSEGQIHTLLDRLAAGKPAPTPPPGWDEVDRDLIAFALDNRDTPLVRGKFPDDYPQGKVLQTLAGSVRTMAVGLSAGEGTRLRCVLRTRKEADARAAAEAVEGLFRLAVKNLAAEKEPEKLESLALAMLRAARINCTGCRVTVSLSGGENVIKMLVAELLGPT